MSKALIEKYLKRYILNYRPETFKLKVLQGELSFTNLILNTHALNEDFDEMNLPLKLEFGLISKLSIDISLIKACLEKIVIDDVVLVVSPDPSKADRNFEVPPEKRLPLLVELFNRFKLYRNWTASVSELQAKIDRGEDDPKGSIKSQLKKTIKNLTLKRCDSLPKSQYKIIDEEELNHVEAFYEKGEPQYQTEEEEDQWYGWLFDQIKMNLSAKVTIKGVKIYYQHTFEKDSGRNSRHGESPEMMIMGINFESLVMNQVCTTLPRN